MELEECRDTYRKEHRRKVSFFPFLDRRILCLGLQFLTPPCRLTHSILPPHPKLQSSQHNGVLYSEAAALHLSLHLGLLSQRGSSQNSEAWGYIGMCVLTPCISRSLGIGIN